MLQNDENIFEGLVTNERTYTELFRNLCRYRFFRDEFARFVIEGSKKDETQTTPALSGFSFTFPQIDTQWYAEDSGTYPDVVIDTDDLRLVIEMKTNTWTGFQPSQPETYLEDLAHHKAEVKGLLLLMPKYHSHERAITDKIDKPRNDADEQLLILVLYWEDFIQRLMDAGAQELNSVFRDYIDLSNEWFANGRIILRPTQCSTLQQSMGQALFSLRALIEVIHARFSSSSSKKLSRIKMTDYDFGFFISDADKTIGYFGVANFAWIYGPSPLLIGGHPHYVKTNNTANLIPAEDEDGLHYWGVPRSLLARPTALDEIAELVVTTFNADQRGKGEVEDDVQFNEAVLTTLFDTKEGPSAFQNLIRTVDQTKVAATGADQNVTIENAASRWEHSLYFSVDGREVAGIGIFFGDWKKKGMPLWVGVPERRLKSLQKSSWKGTVSDSYYREPEKGGKNPWVYRAVDLERLSEQDNLVEFVLRILGMLGLKTNL